MHKFFQRRCLATTAIIGSFAGLANPALAQSGSGSGTPGAKIQLDEVVVTAEHRTQNLQRTPIAITVRSGPDLVEQGRTSVEQILEDVPGVNFVPNVGQIANGDTTATSISIRGIGSNGDVRGNILSLVPAVAEYVDGIVGGIGSSFDVDSVEVLRGPQGTLYGRSATAGVVNIHTKDPSLASISANASGEVGNYNLKRLSVGVNVPLSDTFAIRISGQSMSRDGYEVSDSEGKGEQSDARIKALYKPNDKFSALLGVAYEEREFHSGGTQVHLTPAGIDKSTSTPLGNGHDDHAQYWAKINYDLGFATLTYTAGFRSYNKSEHNIGNYGLSVEIDATNHFKTDTFHTEELRLVSNGNGRLTWQTGLFYYDNNIDTDNTQSIPALGLTLHDGTNRKRTQNLGVFAEATYKLAETTRLTVGVRYDDTKIDAHIHDCAGSTGFLTCLPLDNSSDAQNFTYKVRLDHDLAENFLIYGSVSSAFLPGDVAVETGSTGALVASPYKPETLTSYEVGAKFRGLDNRLQINGAAFFYDYGGFQQSVVLGTIPGPGSVAYSGIESSPARVLGAELEVLYRPTSVDTIEGNASLLDAEYYDKPAIFATSVSQTRIPGMKPFEGSLAYSHLFRLAAGQDLKLKAELEYSSAYDTAGLLPAQAAIPSYAAMQRQGAVALGNLYATWRTGGPVTVSVYIRNVADTFYKTKVIPGGDTVPVNQVELGAPRTFGVVLNAKF
ncbi:MAG: TonB-dependent receptor [Devosia sp.]|nr:TonB-dependent receptor [Devosia sp.]